MYWQKSHKRVNDFLLSCKSRTEETDSVNVTVPIQLISQLLMLKSSVPREEKAHKHRNPGKFELSVMKPNKFLLLISKENSLPIIQKCNKMPKKKKERRKMNHYFTTPTVFFFFFKFSILTFNRNEFQA